MTATDSMPGPASNERDPADASAQAQPATAMPCIRCGHCVDACPAGLSPLLLMHDLEAGRLPLAQAHGLSDCNECGGCDPVCPSRIPLLQIFRSGKRAVQDEARAIATANAARTRYFARQQRLVSELGERIDKHAAQTADAASADAVAAAIDRANARRRARQGEPPQ